MNQPATPTAGSGNGFEVFFKEDGKYYFRFVDKAGEPIFFSRAFPNQTDAQAAVSSVLAGGAAFEMKKSKGKKYYFQLITPDDQELGRSRLFVTKKEMEKKITLLKNLPPDTPAHPVEKAATAAPIIPETALAPPPAVEPAPEKAEKTVAEPPVSIPPPEDAGKMTRYKFSIIYYPNSEVWMVKNDFSGNSIQLGACDGAQIEAFLKKQLPAPAPEAPPAHIDKPATAKTPRVARQAIQLRFRTVQGAELQGQARKNQLYEIELAPVDEGPFQAAAIMGKVTARAMDGASYEVGALYRGSGSLLRIPLSSTQSLKPGTYLFVARLSGAETGGAAVEWYGSQLLTLN